ncbi:MAG: GNAT family N-acetyltransferase [Chloroflexota bacterium]
MSLTVRRATKRDLDDVVRIGMDSVRYHAMFEHTMQIPRNEHKKMRQRFEATLAESNVSTLFVAEAQGHVAGFYSIYIQSIDDTWTPPLFVAGRYGLIAEVAVDKDARGRGIGRQLFAAVEQWFHERSAFAYWLIYLPHNPLSSKFWPALGFVPVWEVLLREA